MVVFFAIVYFAVAVTAIPALNDNDGSEELSRPMPLPSAENIDFAEPVNITDEYKNNNDTNNISDEEKILNEQRRFISVSNLLNRVFGQNGNNPEPENPSNICPNKDQACVLVCYRNNCILKDAIPAGVMRTRPEDSENQDTQKPEQTTSQLSMMPLPKNLPRQPQNSYGAQQKYQPYQPYQTSYRNPWLPQQPNQLQWPYQPQWPYQSQWPYHAYPPQQPYMQNQQRQQNQNQGGQGQYQEQI